ncbi:DUF3419 family protein [Hydrogenophaga sp.]|uniref:DUF3419 family protein n=1 Tax=Hydrogenophaga sp. TaxID=1904254 RepID=UPI0035B479AE
MIPQARFDHLRYANVWEDADTLILALEPHGKRILSICSGGDNVLSLIAAGADEVIAVDLSAFQLAVLRLKVAGFRVLTHTELLTFLGIQGDRATRAALWASRVQADLSAADREFWGRHLPMILRGIVTAGRFERYLDIFGRYVIPWLQPKSRIQALYEAKGANDRTLIWKNWNHLIWRLAFGLFFSKAMLGLGRDPAFLKYVKAVPARAIAERLEHCITSLPLAENPYLNRIISGTWAQCLPHYLRPEHFNAIRNGLSRIGCFHGPIQNACHSASYQGFNLSDIFEYLDEESCRAIVKALADAASPGAKFASWNMMVHRDPATWDHRLSTHREMSSILFRNAKACFYCDFHVSEKVE